MIKINSDTGNLKLQRYLGNANLAVKTAMERLSTGYRINHAKDDAAGLVISTSLGVQTRSLNIANQNAQMAVNVLGVADGALGQMSDLVMRVRDLATQAANGGYSSSERIALDVEAFALAKSLQQLIEGTKFNDSKVLGSTNAIIPSVWVSTAQELKDTLNNNPNSRIILMNDIDLNDLGFDGTGSNWTAVNNFKGIFEGNGYAIKNLKINRSGNQGLFGIITDATIRNVRLENVDIKSTSGYIGGLVGTTYSSTIENCSVSGSISATSSSGSPYLGGLVGYANNSTISNCYSTGTVQNLSGTSGYSDAYIGGLVGRTDSGTIINSYSNSEVTSTNNYSATNYWNFVGGLVGQNSSTITNCYASGNVSALTTTNNYQYAGAFVGQNSGNITNSFSTGNITSTGTYKYVGGFVGHASGGTITNCYSTGQNTATTSGSRGGFIGYNSGSSVNVAFIAQTNGHAAVGGGTSLAISGQLASWFQNASNIGFINSGSTNPVYNNQWDLSPVASGGIPILKKIAIGTAGSNAIKVSTAQELKAALIAPEALNNSNYKLILTNDIDLNDLGFDGSGSNWTAIGTSSNQFTGTIDGNGYAIKNLTMNKTANEQGLFGYASNATFKNIKLVNVNIANTGYSNTGALAGLASNVTLENCSVSGNVKGTSYTGGLVGQMMSGIITNCSSTANVTGTYSTGGIAGWGDHIYDITNCYSSGKITGVNATGGIIGDAYDFNMRGCWSNATVTGTGTGTGGLTGNLGSCCSNEFYDCYFAGSVTGTTGVGGIAGNNYGYTNISNCYSAGGITGTTGVGGFIGSNSGYYLSISSSCSYAAISGNNQVGGLIGGYLSGGSISLYNSGFGGIIKSLSGAGESSSFGGLIGYFETGYDNSAINNCYMSGSNYATIGYRGGLIGQTYNASAGIIDITGTSYKQGLDAIGYNQTGTSLSGTTARNADWFNDTALVKSTVMSGSSAWDFSNGLLSLKWEKDLVRPLTFQIGTDGSEFSAITIDTSINLFNLNFSFATQESARETMENCDHLLKQINNKRGELGASLNIMYSITESNAVTNENLSASKSRIMDADIARESANLVKNQILENVAVSLLSQSKNMSGQLLMQLLGGLR